MKVISFVAYLNCLITTLRYLCVRIQVYKLLTFNIDLMKQLSLKSISINSYFILKLNSLNNTVFLFVKGTIKIIIILWIITINLSSHHQYTQPPTPCYAHRIRWMAPPLPARPARDPIAAACWVAPLPPASWRSRSLSAARFKKCSECVCQSIMNSVNDEQTLNVCHLK